MSGLSSTLTVWLKKLSLGDCVENLLPFFEQVEALREMLYEAERDLYAAADAQSFHRIA